MYKEQFPVQFSVLSSRAFEDLVLSKYPLKRPFKCRFFTPGLNDIYIIKTPANIYYLRVSLHNWRTKEELAAEVELLTRLCSCGVSIAVPLQDNNGEYIQEIAAPEGIRYAVLFCEAKGDKNDNPNQKQNYLLGKMVAQIHAFTDQITLKHKRFELDFKHLIDEPLDIVKPYMEHRLCDFEYLCDIGHQLGTSIRNTLSKSVPEYGICHGDIHHGNIHFSNDGTITLFDFDCFGNGWRAYDIAVYLWHQQLNCPASEKDDSKQKQWEDFLDGYYSERQLGVNELKAVKAFVAIRDIWLLGIQLGSLERNRGCDWLSSGYFDFHIGFIKKWVQNNNII